MKLWVFACEYLRNIKIGFDAGLWAVSRLDRRTMMNRWTKAQKMPPYSRGLIYSSTDRTFTMPFVTTDYPEAKIVEDVWPEPWAIPFPIHPLGSPDSLVSLDAAKHGWPILGSAPNPTHCLNGLNGRTVFVPNEIEKEDWELMLKHLADEEDTFPEPEEPVPAYLRDLF